MSLIRAPTRVNIQVLVDVSIPRLPQPPTRIQVMQVSGQEVKAREDPSPTSSLVPLALLTVLVA